MAGCRLCVVGAGTAGLEGLLYAREKLGDGAELTLIAPEREFRYRAMNRESLFRPGPERGLAIADVVAHVGATWVEDRADAIHQDERTVITRDGDTVPFDYLLLALGARTARTLDQGHVWQRGADPGFLDEVIAALGAGEARSVAVVVPRGARWPLPAYELALVLAWTTADTSATITLITAEDKPLGAIGKEATRAVTGETEAAGLHVITGVEAIDAQRDDPERSELVSVILLAEHLEERSDALAGRATGRPSRGRLDSGSRAEFDRLISLPTVIGPKIAGVSTDAGGFIEVDETLRVCGSERVWAAGSCLAAALEHSALSARQADAAIDAIAAASGVAAGEPPASARDAPELTGMMLTGQRPRWLAENPPGTQEPSTRCLWWPPGRAVGRMLAGQIAAWNPSLQEALPGDPEGVLIQAPVALGCPEAPVSGGDGEVSAETRAARVRDIENRQLRAIERRERVADAGLRDLRARLQTFTRDQHQVVQELRQHGYLLDRDERAARS